MSGFIELEEVELIVENFVEEYNNDWGKLYYDLGRIGDPNRTEDLYDDDYEVNYDVPSEEATAKVHLVIKDEACREIQYEAFMDCLNLWKVTAPCVSTVGSNAFQLCENLTEVILSNATAVGEDAFFGCCELTNVRLPNASSIGQFAFHSCYALRHITVHPNVRIAKVAFYACLSLEVIATCAGFELDMGHKTIGGHVDPTIIITRYLKSQSRQKDVFFTYTLMLELCKAHIDKMGKKTGPERAFPKE
mmetsp:Transcript_7514/g.15142  ORF Transcript_7514/g.15142 Transcript_7514/m.15142 type:complete len:248 (-) Transcript_7514:205-948(-)|eukprot:CAMPEP_0118644656 /NCGR_PEP_ID=MMETSP0785-20121206/7064_1 /TAXON_ID=91992 /ORGANISM="Bolidomonas pacifica, Strain CCMP 1866" /LENGTH=247 /DNA_ID=CAMNT_0006536447 /DNA_START=909 /DNA_END=1652 /DNA_ORIENTATION=-